MNAFILAMCLVFVPGEYNIPDNVPQHLKKAVEDTTRPAEERERDAGRKPAEVLHFFELEPGDRVAELQTGRGWYLGILSRAVGEKGMAFGQNNPFVSERFVKDSVTKRIDAEKLTNTTYAVQELDDLKLPENLDLVVMVLFYHDTYWQKVDREKMNKAVFEALAPGGVFGIVDHVAEAGSGDRDVQSLHRVDPELVKKELLAAGFVLDGESDLLRNPDDTHDYNVFRDVRTNRDQTDRFVYKFRKPI